jgi:hypothetical protein
MKQAFTLITLTLILFGCKKESRGTSSDDFLHNVKAYLADSLGGNDYVSLDFSKAVLNKVDSVNLYFLRVPFKGKSVAGDFVLLKMNKDGIVQRGEIIHLEGRTIEFGEGIIKRRAFDGNILIHSLNRKQVLNSAISRGYITVFHSHNNIRETIYPEDQLPEVVVVAYVDRYGDTDYSTWLWLGSLFYGSGIGGGESSYYGSVDGVGDYYYGGGGSSGNYADVDDEIPGVSTDETMLVDGDTYAAKEAIDIEQFLKCFDNIPDDGAQCEVGIYADIPVDTDPNKIFDFSTGSPGHTFIQIKKISADGTKSVVQDIGFYPKAGWKTGLTNAPTDGKFVDDGMHEYNAAYTKSLTPAEFKSTLTEIRYLKNIQYDIDNYNCTDWALTIFNKHGYGLDIPLYDVPGNLPSSGTSMPQGVYNKLMEMKNNSDPHSDKIQIGFYKGYVTYSNGPCY